MSPPLSLPLPFPNPNTHLEPSPFFRLSPEIRLVIYEHVLPSNGQLYIDLCTPTRLDGEEFVLRKRSIVSTLLKRVMDLEVIVRGGGLQLLLVSRRMHSEIFPLLSALTTRFHCHKCFDELLPQISHGLGVGIQWMRHVEIILDLETQMKQGQMLTMELARAMARETMGLAQKRAWLYYGRLDLGGRERWRYEPLVEGQRGAEGEARGDSVGMPWVGGGPSTWQQGGGVIHNGMLLHAMSNQTVVPAKWMISGWFDI